MSFSLLVFGGVRRAMQPEEAEAYRKAATAKGDETEVLMLVDSGHFDMLSPETSSGIVVEDLIVRSFEFSNTKTKAKMKSFTDPWFAALFCAKLSSVHYSHGN
jgi:hypothetical protein